MKQTQNQYYGKTNEMKTLTEGSTFYDTQTQKTYLSLGGKMVVASNGTDVSKEPAGSTIVSKVVSLTQAQYDAGTPVEGTFYIITDA